MIHHLSCDLSSHFLCFVQLLYCLSIIFGVVELAWCYHDDPFGRCYYYLSLLNACLPLHVILLQLDPQVQPLTS